MESKESEKLGKWLTEDAMKKTGKWSANAIRKMSHTVKSFQSPSSGWNSYMDEFEYTI
jgi:hypothetical protein